MNTKIILKDGTEIIVSPEDFPLLSLIRWHRDKKTNHVAGYVVLQRLVLGLGPMEGPVVDHINRNPLDNRRENLRLASRQQNMQNSVRSIGGVLYRGVSARRDGKTFLARIIISGKRSTLGSYSSAEEAARAWDSAALFHFGEFACTHFPDSEPKSLEQIQHESRLRFKEGHASRYYGVTRRLDRGKRRDRERWVARHTVNGKRVCIGTFDTEEEAQAARLAYLKSIKPHTNPDPLG